MPTRVTSDANLLFPLLFYIAGARSVGSYSTFPNCITFALDDLSYSVFPDCYEKVNLSKPILSYNFETVYDNCLTSIF